MNLKPCPFCGDTETRVSNPDSTEIWVSCNKCNAAGPVDITPQLAEKKWNRRPALTGIRVKVKDGIAFHGGKRGVIFSQPNPREKMVAVLIDGEDAPDLWAWTVLEILGTMQQERTTP